MMRAFWAAVFLLVLCLALDAALLLRAALDQRPDAVPRSVSVIVLDAWVNDAVTRQAFELALQFPAAQVLSIGSLPETATDLQAEGVCFRGASHAEKTRAQLITWGLGADRVSLVQQARRGTHNQALDVRAWLLSQDAGPGPVLVVTEWFHRQRSRLAYRQVLPETEVRVLGGPLQPASSQWPPRDRAIALVSEFLKLAYYQSKGLISLKGLLRVRVRE